MLRSVDELNDRFTFGLIVVTLCNLEMKAQGGFEQA